MARLSDLNWYIKSGITFMDTLYGLGSFYYLEICLIYWNGSHLWMVIVHRKDKTMKWGLKNCETLPLSQIARNFTPTLVNLISMVHEVHRKCIKQIFWSTLTLSLDLPWLIAHIERESFIKNIILIQKVPVSKP